MGGWGYGGEGKMELLLLDGHVRCLTEIGTRVDSSVDRLVLSNFCPTNHAGKGQDLAPVRALVS
jgi:hypothetical protein